MVNYAVIGCGVIGKVHCTAINADSQSNLLYVCDSISARAENLAEIYNCDAVFDYMDILENPSIDVIAICLPHSEHIWLFEEAIRSGKHVLCEKPLATTPDDILKMVELAEKTDFKTTVAFQHRHSPLIQSLQSYVKEGVFGQILGGEINFGCNRTMEYYNSEVWRGKWRTEGGGTLINQAIHTIDLANVFLGEPESLTGEVENRLHSEIEVEDYAIGQIFYEKNN